MLIDGVLEYSRIGRVDEQRICVDLNEMVEYTIDLLSPPERVSVVVESKLPQVVGDPTRLGQVFQNLIGNAVKFNDKPRGEVEIGALRENGFWRLYVSDNGPGIDARHHERIFKIFQTLQTKDEFENSGVGLAIVRRIVESWGGKIWVESEVGRGSTFSFTLPDSC